MKKITQLMDITQITRPSEILFEQLTELTQITRPSKNFFGATCATYRTQANYDMVKRRRTWRPRYHRVKRLKRRKKIWQITDITQGNIKKNFTIKNLRFLHFLRRKLGFRSGILLTTTAHARQINCFAVITKQNFGDGCHLKMFDIEEEKHTI